MKDDLLIKEWKIVDENNNEIEKFKLIFDYGSRGYVLCENIIKNNNKWEYVDSWYDYCETDVKKEVEETLSEKVKKYNFNEWDKNQKDKNYQSHYYHYLTQDETIKKISRVEIIIGTKRYDMFYTKEYIPEGNYENKIEYELQDNGRTLKIFIEPNEENQLKKL